MRDEHVQSILESAPLGQLSASELESVRAHAARCRECERAFAAAQVAATLLRERAAAEFGPSPFFETRVLAALRERRAADETPALLRLWRAAGALASSMAAAVALLAAMTFLQPSTATQDVAVASSDPYSAEAVLVQDETSDEEVDYNQVFTTIYESDAVDAGGDNGQRR